MVRVNELFKFGEQTLQATCAKQPAPWIALCLVVMLLSFVACQNAGDGTPVIPTRVSETRTVVATRVPETRAMALTEIVQPTETPAPTITRTAAPAPVPRFQPTAILIEASKPVSKQAAPKNSGAADNTLFATFMAPIDKAAEKLRKERKLNDAFYDHRVNPDLAKLGTSWLLIVCGIDHEPPTVEKVTVCSNSLMLVRRDGAIDTITFTHDTRFPEQEIEERILGKENSARRSDALWLRRTSDTSGLGVLRESYQDATGLPVDFIIVIQSDLAIKEFVDKVFGKLKVDVPLAFTAHPIYLNEETKLPERKYQAGTHEFNGASVLQYLKAVPVAVTYPPELENNERKHTVFRAIFNAIDEQKFNPLFWPPFLFKLNDLIQNQIKCKNIIVDFDMAQLIVSNLSAVAEEAKSLVLSGNSVRLGIPGFGKARYYVDPSLGTHKDSPIQWGTLDSQDPFAKRDIETLKIYQNYYVEVPKNGDALNPDLVNGYWKPVRLDVEKFLLGQ